uniref:Anaphase-promoting complex subunit 1 C-terminal domain-containing protein n=1 Tax=Kalmanozyma brasiliensis (strain GHG001) TaxID=1365824 RepID=V5E6P4_KALBG
MPTGTIDGMRLDAMEVDDAILDDGDVDLARVADMDSFARSFACTCLLDEIKIPHLNSASDLADLRVSGSSFGHIDSDATYLFLSMPTHRLFAQDPLLQGLAPFTAVDSAGWNAAPQGTLKNNLDPTESGPLLFTLYLLAEEMQLDTSHSQGEVKKVAELSAALAQRCRSSAWTEALRCRVALRQGASQLGQGSKQSRSMDADGQEPPQDFYQVLRRLLSGSRAQASSLRSWIEPTAGLAQLTHAAAAFPMLDAVLRTFSVFSQAHKDRQHLAAAVVESTISNGLDLERLRALPFGISLPLYEAMRCCQVEPPSGKSAAFYHMTQRAELVLNAWPLRGSLSTANARKIPEQLVRTLPEDVSLDAICAQLFSRDFRLRDVVAMLRTDSINSVYVAEGESQTETAITEQHNAAVAAIGERTKALPAGRAMLFMTSQRFSPTHKWRIPSICLTVKVRPRGLTIEPETKADAAGLDWPEFHNGVASVLELHLASDITVDSKWIFAHLGEQVTARHAGFLYGLGLMKQLPSLTPIHVFRYLKMRNNLLTIGFLLGVAVSTVGTADPTARNLIGMQLPAFLPPDSAPLNLSTITQTAGLLAMGLLFLGSNHRWTAKRMLDQIGAQESSTPHLQPQYREAYSLSAGLALGLVYLGKGRGEGMKSLPDKRILARLIHLIQGSSNVGKGATLAGGLRADDAGKDAGEINLTSAPAALALGLVYLRSGSPTMADVVAPPRTARELDSLRPDVLFAHVLARYLILWDIIQPTKEWLFGVLPMWMQRRIECGKTLSEAAQLAQINMETGACFVIGLKYAGSKDAKASHCLWEQLNRLEKQAKVQAVSFFAKIRKSALQAALDQARIALAMVLAGSGDVDLLRHLRRAHGDVDGDTCYGSHMATHMALGLLFLGGGRFTLGTSDLAVAALLISFVPPFPRSSGDNRAHLQAFRHLWYLAIEPRLLVATDVDSNQLVSLPVHIAEGDAIASDNKRTFTPLLLPNRHLSGSIRSATDRYWSASIDGSSISDRNVVTGSAAARAARASASATSQMLFVKRKAAHLDYLADPNGSRSLTSRALETAPMDVSGDAAERIGPGVPELREATRGFSAAGKQCELVRCLGQISGSSSDADQISQSDATVSAMRALVMECLTMDKMYVLPAYASIVQLKHDNGVDALFQPSRDIRLADDFYQHHFARLFAEGNDDGASKPLPLVQPALLTLLRLHAQEQARKVFEGDAAVRDAVTECLISRPGVGFSAALLEAEDAWKVMVMSEMPSMNEVRGLVDFIRQFIRSAQPAAGPTDATQLREKVHMVTDAAFGGPNRAPWTAFILDHVIDELLGGS